MRFALIPAALILIFFIGATQAQQRANLITPSDRTVVQQAPTRILIPELEPNNTQTETDGGSQAPIPTIIIPSPISSPTPSPTTAPAQPTATPTIITDNDTFQCQEVGCVVWTRQFTVDHTMNRWQVWETYIGPSMMPWRQFAREAMSANPILWHDGYMYKVGKQYLLPVCVDLGEH